ncbi:hypothetical protein ACFLUS_01680 [Chloroflexota bacterium]
MTDSTPTTRLEDRVDYITVGAELVKIWNIPIGGKGLIAPYPGAGRPFLTVAVDPAEITVSAGAALWGIYYLDETVPGGKWLYYIPDFVSSSLTMLEPGKYYYVVVSAPSTLTILQGPNDNTPAPTSDTESVSVYKILDFDRAMIIRENGEAWVLEKGVGCLSLDSYEGRRILIYSPRLFAGVGSKIILPDRDQQCRIWDAEFLGIKSTIIESHINGTFEGWDGDTVFELRNGQIWQQASYSYTYHYAYSPEVFIYSTTGGYKMMVDSVSETIYVRRLK